MSLAVIIPSADVKSGAGPQPMVELLRRPLTYGEGPLDVEVIETHISWIFLTDRFAYKLKKPVRFEFLDYSTLEARRVACQDELRLNRRLAASVYLGVVPIVRQSNGSLRLEGSGEVVDWVVKMRRLPADRMLDVLLQNDRLTEFDLRKLSATLAQFYAGSPPLTIRPDEYRREIEAHVRANRAELLAPEHDLPAAVVNRVHAAQLRLLALTPGLFDMRVCDGRVIEGHGDLRPEHVCVEAAPVVFDCVEFSQDFRQIDVVDELCFLAMECERLGAPHLGERVLDAYYRLSGDRPGEQLIGFYKAYRACVRAKVAALRARQMDSAGRREQLDLAQRYLELADGFVAPLGRPLMVVVCGLTGTGKSTLAASLAGALGADLLRTDVIRQEVLERTQPSAIPTERYSASNRTLVYKATFARADSLLSEGVSVVLDGTFLSESVRRNAIAVAAKRAATVVIVHCVCPREVAIERIQVRLDKGEDPSEAQPELYDVQLRQEEPFAQDLPRIEIDTSCSLSLQIATALQQVPGSVSGSTHMGSFG